MKELRRELLKKIECTASIDPRHALKYICDDLRAIERWGWSASGASVLLKQLIKAQSKAARP